MFWQMSCNEALPLSDWLKMELKQLLSKEFIWLRDGTLESSFICESICWLEKAVTMLLDRII